jgi:hypothetical protein
MWNLLISLAVGGAVFAGLFVPSWLRLGEAIVPAVFVALIAYFIFARRTFKKVEALFNAAMKALQAVPPRFELAVGILEQAYAYARQQIGVRTQVDAQLGVLYFLQKEFDKAVPYLQSSRGFGHWMATAMLAVVHYKRKHYDAMREAALIASKRGKKQSLAWALRAYLLAQTGDRDGAMAVLAEGIKKTDGDTKLNEFLLALQNNKKMKMRVYKEQWYQFHLERPPVQYQQVAMGGKVSKAARRGRW